MPPWWIIWINNPYLDFSTKEKTPKYPFSVKKLESKARGQFSRSWIFLFLPSPNYDSTYRRAGCFSS